MNKILVAERKEALCLVYQEELREQGYDVITISNPEKFLQALESENPDLIIMDIARDEIENGILLRDIRSNGHRMPIILGTIFSSCSHTMRYLGVNEFFKISSNFSELKAMVRRLLEGLETPGLVMPGQRRDKKEGDYRQYLGKSSL